jgi:hypothetical protein
MNFGRRFWGRLGAFVLIVSLLVMVLLRDVLQREYISPDASPMTLSVNLKKANTCSGISPEFEISGIPAGADLVCLSIHDLNIDYDHGGGCIVPPQSSTYIVNAGALIGYLGPCPKSSPHSYRFRLEARTVHDLVIGIGESTLPCCSDLAK